MNIFNKYGIKEVADVVFYSITRIDDTEFYTPVLFFDTLKTSSLSKTIETVNAFGGKANKKILSWSFDKDIKLKLEDALFSQASLNMYLNGRMQAKMGPYISVIAKTTLANQYEENHYSTIAYPSPKLTDEEWEIVFQAATDIEWVDITVSPGPEVFVYSADEELNRRVGQRRRHLQQWYYVRDDLSGYYPHVGDGKEKAMPQPIIDQIIKKISNLQDFGKIDNELYESKMIERWEKCIVKNPDGLLIDTASQKQNILDYYQSKDKEVLIYYDIKTMLPLFGLNNEYDINTSNFKLKQGTEYYKFTRTVQRIKSLDTIMGIDLKINPEIFSSEYKIVGETYVRNQKDSKDQRCQFVINNAKIAASTNIDLKADGGPSVFSIEVNVLNRDKPAFELIQYDIEDDEKYGGTKIVPQYRKHSYTPVQEIKDIEIEDNNIYY